MRRRIARLGAWLALLAALPASAQERPPRHVTRDFDVRYVIEPFPGAPEMTRFERRVLHLAAERLQREENLQFRRLRPIMILNLLDGTVILFSDETRRIMTWRTPDVVSNYATEDFVDRATWAGEAEVAGHRCRVWRLEVQVAGRPDPVVDQRCLTQDGVLLRAETIPPMRRTEVAVEVRLDPLDRSRFVAPEGYEVVTERAELERGLR